MHTRNEAKREETQLPGKWDEKANLLLLLIKNANKNDEANLISFYWNSRKGDIEKKRQVRDTILRKCKPTSMANHRSLSTLFQTDDSSLQPQSCSSFGNDPWSSLRVETKATTWQPRLVSRKWSGAMPGTNNWSSSIKQGGRKRAVRAGYYFHWKRKKKKTGQLDREKAAEKA